jgi:hypothetical protein
MKKFQDKPLFTALAHSLKVIGFPVVDITVRKGTEKQNGTFVQHTKRFVIGVLRAVYFRNFPGTCFAELTNGSLKWQISSSYWQERVQLSIIHLIISP